MAEAVRSDSGEAARQDETDKLHFGGPVGAALFTVFLPAISLYLWICVHKHDGSLVFPSVSLLREVPLPTARGLLIFLVWLTFQVALDVLLPAKKVKGFKQRDGVVMTYRLNGWRSLWVSVAVLFGVFYGGVVTGTMILEELGALLSIAVIFSYLFSGFLYAYGLRSERDENRTGNVVYDYFMGTSLNPRIGEYFDLKFFFESKIGLTSWIALVMAMAAAEIEREGGISTPMVLVGLFQLWYVADFYWFEEAMLSTWDINYENYGFMLAMGFVIWMPFNFSLQSQYLVYHQPELPIWALALLVVFNFAGYFVFRTANLQKHKFRTDPDTLIWGKKPSFIATKRGTKLLTSGWWGIARHANYLGDLMMALAWCLPAGFSHVTPYFYFIYFAPLLLDRERRDNHVCKQKYGDDWDTYCAKVKYRILPGVY
jgi:protein-S-isoprenylcysteine O-methyltransferase Ste14